MLNQAIDWKLITENVVQRTKRPKVPKHRHAYWTPPQIVQFLDAIQGERLEAAFWIMLTCGLRRGEICGLRDEDLRQVIDPQTGEPIALLSIQRKLLRETGHGLQVSEPKADSARVVALEPRVFAKVKAWQTTRAQDKRLAGPRRIESGYLFTSRVGTPIEPRNLDRTFQRMLQAHGFGHLKLHELRHSFARALLAANESSKAVQQALGHATMAMTVDLYGDMILGTERQVVRTIGRILDTTEVTGNKPSSTPR
jgi:integrase